MLRFARHVLLCCASSAAADSRAKPNKKPKEAPDIKLTYFGIRGLGEAIRMTLSECGLEFENVHVDRDQWFSKIKQEGIESGEIPFGQLPQLVLREPGAKEPQILVQSGAILNYIGAKCNLLPSDLMERAKVDMAIGGVGDIRSRYAKLCYNKDALTDPSLLNTYADEELPKWLGYFEGILAKSKSGFVADEITIADIVLFESLEENLRIAPKAITGMKHLAQFMETMVARPGIKKWITSPKRTPHCNGAPAASLDTQDNKPTCDGNGIECLRFESKTEL